MLLGLYGKQHYSGPDPVCNQPHTLSPFFLDLLCQVGTNVPNIMIYSKDAEARLSKAMEELHETAIRDKLTGLYNRIKIDEILPEGGAVKNLL